MSLSIMEDMRFIDSQQQDSRVSYIRSRTITIKDDIAVGYCHCNFWHVPYLGLKRTQPCNKPEKTLILSGQDGPYQDKKLIFLVKVAKLLP